MLSRLFRGIKKSTSSAAFNTPRCLNASLNARTTSHSRFMFSNAVEKAEQNKQFYRAMTQLKNAVQFAKGVVERNYLLFPGYQKVMSEFGIEHNFQLAFLALMHIDGVHMRIQNNFNISDKDLIVWFMQSLLSKDRMLGTEQNLYYSAGLQYGQTYTANSVIEYILEKMINSQLVHILDTNNFKKSTSMQECYHEVNNSDCELIRLFENSSTDKMNDYVKKLGALGIKSSVDFSNGKNSYYLIMNDPIYVLFQKIMAFKTKIHDKLPVLKSSL